MASTAAAFDYSALLTTATSLIGRFGRAMTLRRYAAAAADPTDPTAPPDPAGTDIQSITACGVFLDLERDGFTTSGVGIARGSSSVEEKNVRVLVQAVSTLPEEIGTDWSLIDGTRRWKVVKSKPVHPGDTLIYYELEVRL